MSDAPKRKHDELGGDADEDTEIQIGDTVQIMGLKSTPELNGSLAIVEAWEGDVGRWRVQVASNGEVKRVKPENLQKVADEVDDEGEEVDKVKAEKRARILEINPEVQSLVEGICDTAMMQRFVRTSGYNDKEVPINDVARSSIKEGLTWLRAVEQQLLKEEPSRDALEKLSKSFYKSSKFDALGAEVVASLELVKEKVDAVEGLADVELVYNRIGKIAEGRSGRKKVDNDEAETDDDPSKSKRPKTAYFRFLDVHRTKIMEDLAKRMGVKPTIGQCAKEAAVVWKALSEEERDPFESAYRSEKDARDKEIVAYKLRKETEAWEADPLVQRYNRMLGCSFRPVARGSPVWRMIAQSVLSTQPEAIEIGSHFVRLERVFNVVRASEEKQKKSLQSLQNRKLLWYGVPLARWAASLCQGLRPPLPESPFTGYSFGKGIYFSDMVSVAAENACAGNVENGGGRALLLLAEVALGRSIDRYQADARGSSKLPAGFTSIVGHGRLAPSTSRVLSGGVKLPVGPVEEQQFPGRPDGSSLAHNEYVVYNPMYIRMRYLVEVELVEGSAQDSITEARAEMQSHVDVAVANPQELSTNMRLRKKTSGDQTLMFR